MVSEMFPNKPKSGQSTDLVLPGNIANTYLRNDCPGLDESDEDVSVPIQRDYGSVKITDDALVEENDLNF